MKQMSLKEIAAACGGTYFGNDELAAQEVTGVAIDSRKIETGFLFVPIKGARVDGHDFIPQVIEKGSSCRSFRKTARQCILSIHPCRIFSSSAQGYCPSLPSGTWN